MTTEEKLQHFYDFSIQSADKEATEMLDEYTVALDNIFREHQEAKHRQAQAQLNDEVNKTKRDFNKSLSTEQLKIKRALSKKHNELKDILFKSVEEKLLGFKNTETYETYLIDKMQDALHFANGDELTIYIDPSDASLADKLSEAIHHEVCISREEFLGGMRAVISSKNILIDHSFVSMIRDEKEQFAFTGGTLNE